MKDTDIYNGKALYMAMFDDKLNTTNKKAIGKDVMIFHNTLFETFEILFKDSNDKPSKMKLYRAPSRCDICYTFENIPDKNSKVYYVSFMNNNLGLTLSVISKDTKTLHGWVITDLSL
ncbi:hypothetical protein [Myroides odoratimimus]|uniref:hypothetical protein n=2 Tax=Myroides odoratimimus TaxID=76832 RepID=UPI00257898CC|nr:hypothetical protein [Myroides odoratimimus]MDM1535064.1 hypothetical protein [Myroides odoratimimus]